jgi:hypothetical protein
MPKYEQASEGLQVRGEDSYHVVKIFDKDDWLILRRRGGVYFECAKFVSPDEARAFALSLDLTLSAVK